MEIVPVTTDIQTSIPPPCDRNLPRLHSSAAGVKRVEDNMKQMLQINNQLEEAVKMKEKPVPEQSVEDSPQSPDSEPPMEVDDMRA